MIAPEWLEGYLQSRAPDDAVTDEDSLMRAWLIKAHWALMQQGVELTNNKYIHEKKCVAHGRWAARVKKESTSLYKVLNRGCALDLMAEEAEQV